MIRHLEFRATGSLEETAAHLLLSTYKIRKLLITAGEWSSPFSVQVGRMKNSGQSVADIAAALNVSANLVSAYLPYDKTVYKVPDRTKDAARSDHYRQRNKKAAARAVNRKSGVYPAANPPAILPVPDAGAAPGAPLVAAAQRTGRVQSAAAPIRLHLSLSQTQLNEEQQRILRRHGESSTGTSLSRDILIPADMPLHVLHYAIQRLFGWQNSHLRSFELPDEVFSRLTDETVRGWFKFVGLLFRFTMGQDDQFWNDDYQAGSVNAWLKKKYTGPYVYRGVTERYAVAQKSVRHFIERFPQVDVRAGFRSPAVQTQLANSDPSASYRPVIVRRALLVELTV